MDKLQTNKPGWKIWRFDQIATSVTDRIDDPAEADVEYYVGLEHLDSDSLKIRRWGVPTDVEATKLRFRKGDIIFGRRRVYQRKVGVAEFDGICSAHALVLRPKTDVVLPEFLPFFMQSDLFMNRALEISVGSLSPTINWKTLASQEFALPPMEEQRRVSQIFIRQVQVIHSLKELANATLTLLNSLQSNLLSGEDLNRRWSNWLCLEVPDSWKAVTLDKLLSGVIDYRGRTPQKSNSGVPLITARNIRNGYLSLEPEEFIPINDYDGWMTRGIPQPGDVFFTMEAPLGYVAPVPDFRFALAQRIVVLQPNQMFATKRFLYWLMRSPHTQQEILKRATGTTAKGIKQSTLITIPVLLPPLYQQEQITEKLDATLIMQKKTDERLANANSMLKLALSTCLQDS